MLPEWAQKRIIKQALTKKAPAESVTDLALNQINDVIRDVKELLQDDPYIQQLVEFIPAGDNPELRDALLVIGQIRQGLKRPLRACNYQTGSCRAFSPVGPNNRVCVFGCYQSERGNELLNRL